MHGAVDARPGGVATSGPEAVDALLAKALLAVHLHDHDLARGLVVRATRLSSDARADTDGETDGDTDRVAGAPAPVLRRALRLLGARVFEAVAADRDGEAAWFDALLGGLGRPGDDVTLVVLAALQTVASVRPLPRPMVEEVRDRVAQFRGPDATTVVDRVALGRADERDVVLDVLRVVALVEETLPDPGAG